MVVVDPGVGSSRAPLAIRCERRYLVGPDNGVFELVLQEAKRWTARQIERAAARLPETSATFHGRDIFAPAAAWLARGGAFHRIGPKVAELTHLSWPVARQDGSSWVGEVIHLDTFGNALTNLPNACVGDDAPDSWEISLPRRKRGLLHDCYAAVPPGEPVVVRGSTGWLEIAINQGSAAERLGLIVGSLVRLQRVPPRDPPPRLRRPQRGQ
jgi:S-adenosylmethionine hydrolase